MREGVVVDLSPRWLSARQVAGLLGFGESKVRFLILQGDLRSLKVGKYRRVMPEWVDEYVARQVAAAEDEFL